MHRAARDNAYAVVLVGGKGKRLRPLSTDVRPKAFLSVTADRRTLFRKTLDRVLKLVDPSHIVVVANRAHLSLVKKDLPKASHKNIILEPVSRNTAPAIALAADRILRADKDAIMIVLPTDHYVPDADKQISGLRKGLDFVARNEGVMVTVGLKPGFPSTGFGYIEAARSPGIVKVKRFTEKPDLKTASRYVKGGRHLWNAGIFIFKAGTLLSAVKMHAPLISECLRKADIDKAYDKMPDISIDYAVMEKYDNIYCVKGRYGWSDVGGFEALEKVLKKESRRFVKENGKITRIL